MRSWEVRAATALVALGALPGAWCLVLAFRAMESDPGFLFAVLPIVIGVLLLVGGFIISGALALTVRLIRGDGTVRLQTLLLGLALVVAGLFTLMGSGWIGVLLTVYGGTLAWLMSTAGAARDLGDWTGALRQPAPWGSTPGTGIWSEDPAVQGPWAPDPKTLPWLSWKGTSGPRTPWWQTWQAGLSQGMPLWELLAVAASLVAFVAALVAAALPGYRGLGVLLMLPALGGVVLVEQRMRERLSGRAR